MTCPTLRLSLALAPLAALLACASAQVRPEAAVSLEHQELVLASQSLTELTAALKGALAAPTDAVLEGARVEVVLEGQVVDEHALRLDLPVPAGTGAPFAFQLQVPYVRGAKELEALSARGGALLLAFRGELQLRVGGARQAVPFAASRPVRAPRLPSFTLVSLDAGRYSAERVSLHFGLGVQNPNPFPLKLDQVSYEIRVAGKPLAQGAVAKGATIDAASTRVHPAEISLTDESYGGSVAALTGTGAIPYSLLGEISGALFRVPFSLEGAVKLEVPR